MKTAVSISIRGRVQNVGFRYHTQTMANKLGVMGFVKNLSDGSVYVEAEAEQDVIDRFVEWCNKGPIWSRVNLVQVNSIPVNGYTDFRIH